LLRSGPPTEPSSAEFAPRLAAAGRRFAEAGVAAVYLVHGTFTGNDALGLLTELARYAPNLAESLRKLGKRAINAILGETGNYTPQFAARMEMGLSGGVDRRAPKLPVRLFNWSGLNHHVARADAAVRLIDELARLAPGHDGETERAKRVLLWAHSHGGNVLALMTNLLGGDQATSAEFFDAARIFFRRPWSERLDFPVWQRVEELLAGADHPLRRLQLDLVTFGAPIRYGWDSAGYSKLLHIVNHRPAVGGKDHQAPYPPRLRRIVAGTAGDFIQQLGIAGSNIPPLPLVLRTFLANRRLGRVLERDLPRERLFKRLKRGVRVHDEGTTLLEDYDDPDRIPFRHLLGHAPYTRSRWLPLHCELVAQHFYAAQPAMI